MKITLLWNYLKYDADQLMHRYANVRKEDPVVREYADMSGSDTSDENLIRRLIVTGVAHLRKRLRDHIEHRKVDADDTLVTNQASYIFQFLECSFDGYALAEIMHWFVIRYAMWQWCLTYAPDEANNAKNELDSLDSDLDRILSDMAMPIKDRRTDGVGEEDAEIEIIYGTE